MPTEPIAPPAPTTDDRPAPRSDHDRTARTVLAVVAVVALAGALGALLGGGRTDAEVSRRAPTGALTTPPAEVAPPTEVELPGPTPPNLVGTGPGRSVRVVGQDGPGTTIELPTDLGEDDTTTEADPGAEEPSEPGGEPSDPGDEPAPPADEGELVLLPDDLSVVLPEGWESAGSGDGYWTMTTPGAAFEVGAYRVDETVTAADLVAEETRVRTDTISELRVSDVADIPVNTSHVSGGAGRTYEGILVSQNGSVAVEGDLYAIVLDDGTGYTFTTTTQLGDYETHGADLQALVSSILASIEARP